jgi:hypothetical protein
MADFKSRYISEVEGGKGLIGGAKEAAKGSVKDFGKKFSKENLIRSVFGGDDLLSAAIRSKLGVKKEKKEKDGKASPEGSGFSSEGITFLKIIAKNSMSLPGMARDMNVLRQNVQKLVKIKAGPQKKGKKAYATAADTFFLREDEREKALEAQRGKVEGKPTAQAPGAGKDKEGGFLESIMSLFSGGFTNAIKTIFSPKTLMKVFSKVFLPLAIIGTLFSGIMDGFKRYQETGNLGDAIVAGLGGMLNFVTFGLFGEDTLKTLFDSISNFFQPITDTISSIFTGIKDFVKGLFGGKIDVKDDAPAKADNVKATMPDPKQFATGMAKASGASDEKSADIGGLFDAVGKGDAKGLFGKAQEFANKYPQEPASATSPTAMSSEGVPLDQAQRNYELNKQLTGEASKALGVPLQMPAPPTPATPAAPVATAPTPSPEMSDADKIKQLEGYIEGNKNRFARRESDAERHIASFKKRYANDPSRVKELQDDYASTLAIEKKEMEEANAGFQRQIDSVRKSGKGAVMASSGPSPSVDSGGGGSAAPASAVSSGGGGAGGAEAMGGASSAPSGSAISQSSSQVAEAQRMESAADDGSTINAPTNNSSSSSQGKASGKIGDVYDTELASILTRA